MLSDPARRAEFDRTGRTGATAAPATDYGHDAGADDAGAWGRHADQHARDVFSSLWQDVDVLRQALMSLGEGLRQDAGHAFDHAKSGDVGPVLAVLAKYKGPLAIGIGAIVLLRIPALIAPVVTGTLAVIARNPAMALRAGVAIWGYLVQQAQEHNADVAAKKKSQDAASEELRRRGHNRPKY